MGPTRLALGALILALPVGVEIPALRDSTGSGSGSTRLELAGGAGYYALIARDCEGVPYDHLPVRYHEAGGSITLHLAGALHVGLRGGIVSDEVGTGYYASSLEPGTRDNAYVNPNASLEWRYFGIGGGWVHSRREFPLSGSDVADIVASGHMRIGPAGHYLSMGLMENVPLYSAGGYFDLGLGFRPSSGLDAWAGISAGGPFDATGAALKADWWVTRRMSVDLRARLGYSGGQYQNGVSVGVSVLAGPR